MCNKHNKISYIVYIVSLKNIDNISRVNIPLYYICNVLLQERKHLL